MTWTTPRILPSLPWQTGNRECRLWAILRRFFSGGSSMSSQTILLRGVIRDAHLPVPEAEDPLHHVLFGLGQDPRHCRPGRSGP